MNLCKCLEFLCVWICLSQAVEGSRWTEILAPVSGDYILDLGNQYNNSELRLIGKVYKNFERNMSKVLQQTRIEYFLQKLCNTTECEDWPKWPACPAPKGHFGVIQRTRECGQNTTKCKYQEDQIRTEIQIEVCAGELENMPDDDADENEWTNPCPSAFQFVSGHCLRLETGLFLTQSSARYECENVYNGLLLHIDSVEKMDAVHSLLNDNALTNANIWLEGYKPGVWSPYHYWNRTEPDFDRWTAGHPKDEVYDGVYGQMVDVLCKIEFMDPSNVRSWMSESCEEEYNFVCEYII